MAIGAAVLAAMCMSIPVAAQTLRSQTRVVQIDVVVKDSKGRPVEELSKQDFTVTDSHRPRAIQIFSVDRGERDKASLPPLARGASAPNFFSNRVQTTVESGHVTAIVFDGNNTTFDDFSSARQQIIDLLGKLKSGDRMAIYVLYRGLAIIQDYTSDREALLKSITAYRPPPLTPRPAMGRRPPRTPGSSMSPLDDVSDELTIEMSPAETAFMVRRRAEDTMAAFRAISSHMAILPGRKSVIWVTGGFSWRQLVNSKPAFDAATAAMNNANVALYAVDARLLMHGTENNIATMRRFAEATGGKAYYHRNDLDNAVQEAMEDSHVVYTLGFYLADDERDGKFHPLHVSVNRRGLQLRYRQGYYAEKESDAGPGKKKKDLDAELLNPVDATDIGIDAAVDVMEDSSGKKLRIHMKLDPGNLTLQQSGAEWIGKLDYLFVERAADGAIVARVATGIQFQVTEKTRVAYEAGTTVFPASIRLVSGAVTLHIIVRDMASGRTGSLTVPLKSVLPE